MCMIHWKVKTAEQDRVGAVAGEMSSRSPSLPGAPVPAPPARPRAAPPPPRPASIPGPAPRARRHRGPVARGSCERPVSGGARASPPRPSSGALSIAGGGQMQAERGARGGRGRRPGRDRPGGDRDRERAGAAAAVARGGGDGGGRRGRGRGFRGGRGGRGGGAPRGGRREPGGRGAWARAPVEDDSDAETFGEENEEQGNYSKRKIVSNWDRYQDIEKEVNNESGESQRGTDFSVLLSSAGDSFSQFRFVEEKEWDGEASCPKQNSAFYVDCESLVRALQELPLSLRLNVAAELVQTTLPLELPQVKPKRNDEGKGRGMQLKGPLGPGGRGSAELKSVAAGCPMYLGKDSPGPTKGSREPTGPLQSAAGPLEEELDLLLSLDAPIKEGENILPDQTSQDRGSEKDGEVAPEEKAPAEPSVVEEKNVEPEQASTSKTVTEEELEDWLDSMIS
ncbi:cell death regulator Aven [Panthera pardus]|uniref:Cell death regulator Aven n=1 Tax=Panthera pardus TaxID=9691 RepID=A0A9W2UE54_PANPR|nr:cell death regulator Aven [Panthera leo]XP_049470079.1 cell death regulator Aven [Panthera uncia]XP_053744698.1 cell death regulator Aven [Panthera pardus]